MATPLVYPVHVDAALDPRLSRWLWLVKWVLAVPHYVVLALLWLGFAVTSVIAFFAILATGRYPRSIFTYNVGVLRWSWRVTYYAYGALGTDRYPPFTLDEVEDYPAHLSIDYPEHLSRGLVLVKWWLLALPHYVIVAIFLGGTVWTSSRSDEHWQWNLGSNGLVGILVLIAAVILAVTGSYPRSLFDAVLGMQRWALRVAAYAGLMTDVYPPFRLDQGGSDPSQVALSPAGPSSPPVAPAGHVLTGAAPASQRSWTAGRIVMLLSGSVVCLMSLSLLAGAAGLAVVDRVSRDGDGYLTSPSVALASTGYAISSDPMTVNLDGAGSALPSRMLGTVRFRVTAQDAAQPVFVGVAPTATVETYLRGVGHATWHGVNESRATMIEKSGSAPATAPAQQDFWTVSTSGAGTQALSWTPTAGEWSMVVMNTDGTNAVAVRAAAAATAPGLLWIALALALTALVMAAVGVPLVGLAVRSASRAVAPAQE